MTDRKPRQTKTPRQRAEEAVAVLERTHARLMHKRDVVIQETKDIERELRDVERRLEHARSHPDLTTEPS